MLAYDGRLRVYDGSSWRTPPKVGTEVELTNRSNGYNATTLLLSAPAGLYRVDVYHSVTTAAPGYATSLRTVIGYTDDIGVHEVPPAGDLSFGTRDFRQGTAILQVANNTEIYALTTLTVDPSPWPGRYAVRIRLEAL